MTIDLRWLAFLLPLVLPFAIAGTIGGVFAMTGAELMPENREGLAIFSLFSGFLVGTFVTIAVFEIYPPIYRKLW